LGRCVQRSVAVVFPCAAEPDRAVLRPQHALPGNTPPPRDVVPLPGELTTYGNGNTCNSY